MGGRLDLPEAQGRAGKSIPPYVKLGQLVRFKVTDYEEWYKNL